MKKVFIMIHDLGSGGAQKSLISFLNVLKESGKLNNYKIDLLVCNNTGLFSSQIPSEINVLPENKLLYWMSTSVKKKDILRHFSIVGILGKTKWYLSKHLLKKKKKLCLAQTLWASWNKLIPKSINRYDIAISYMHGLTNYYVIDKVCADKKVLWIHIEYQKIKANPAFDMPYYSRADRIITISDKCVNSFVEVFPKLKESVYLLENITSAKEVLDKANEDDTTEYSKNDTVKILSIGRLHTQKGFDLAIKAASLLKQDGIAFEWLILGKGEDKEKLEELAATLGVADCVKLLGIRSNPYVYMKQADLIIQSSRWEGKSIVLDEAKILEKPIIVTEYPTVHDEIKSEVDGLIVPMNEYGIYKGILRMVNDAELKNALIGNLHDRKHGNTEELKKYVDVMLSDNLHD